MTRPDLPWELAAVSDKPVLEVETVAEWEAWLEGNPNSDGVRLRLRKKACTQPGITYAEALDSALCFGWIDGQAGSLDEHYHLQASLRGGRNSRGRTQISSTRIVTIERIGTARTSPSSPNTSPTAMTPNAITAG